jgi:hypothetical protein
VIATGVPPSADTREIALTVVPEKMIVPQLFQLPPRASGASQMICIGPPSTATFLSLPSAKKAIERPSGDQNG